MTFSANIASLIERLGEPVTFSYSVGDSINADTGQRTAGSPVSITANGVPSNYNNAEIDGTVIRSGDIKLTITPTSPLPQAGWNCTLDEVKHRVESIKTVRKSGETIVYTVQLRLA